MKITVERQGETFVILNKGRKIASYFRESDAVAALQILDRLAAQVARPEAFCTCMPKLSPREWVGILTGDQKFLDQKHISNKESLSTEA